MTAQTRTLMQGVHESLIHEIEPMRRAVHPLQFDRRTTVAWFR